MWMDGYDSGIESRDVTDDQGIVDARRHQRVHVMLQCATIITSNYARVKEFGLVKMWKSP